MFENLAETPFSHSTSFFAHKQSKSKYHNSICIQITPWGLSRGSTRTHTNSRALYIQISLRKITFCFMTART